MLRIRIGLRLCDENGNASKRLGSLLGESSQVSWNFSERWAGVVWEGTADGNIAAAVAGAIGHVTDQARAAGFELEEDLFDLTASAEHLIAAAGGHVSKNDVMLRRVATAVADLEADAARREGYEMEMRERADG